MAAEILLLRHGETVWNRQRRMQGLLDSPLTARGIAQAQAMGRTLGQLIGRGEGFAMRSSPLGRAWQTAVIVAETMQRSSDTIIIDHRLVEMTWGRWDGLTADEIAARDPKLWQRRLDDRFTVPPPDGGETQADVLDRAREWLESCEADQPLIVVAHGALNRAIRVVYTGAAPASMLELDEPQDAILHCKGGRIDRIAVP